MTDTYVISGLVKRRSTLSGEIARAQARLRKMHSDLATLDATIRMFDVDYPIGRIKPRGECYRKDWKSRGEMIRLIFSILRNTSRPMTVREIAIEVMANKQMDTNNRKAVESMWQRVGRTLRKKRDIGQLRSYMGPDYVLLWEIVTDANPSPLAANILSTVG